MLTTLLESRSHRTRNTQFAVASATVHAVLIFVAAYATALGAAAKVEPDDPVVIHWLPMAEPRHAANAPLPDRAQRTWSVFPAKGPLAISIEVPSTLPSINLELAAVTPDFVGGATGNPDAADQSLVGYPEGDGKRYYDAAEVETAVGIIGNTIPEYPSALRASGIEGTVAAEFVVTESGRADVSSLRIMSATNEAFAEAVRRALPRMRFRPAKIGARAVSQMVQQQFVFRLNR
jgi:TonB family protein